MAGRELRRNLAVLPIGTVRELTMLSDRQIRYYEDHDLVSPKRGGGGQRRYSLNDVDRLLDIRDYLDMGHSTQDIKEMFAKQEAKRKSAKASEAALRRSLQDEFAQIARFK
ncbi:MerR family transcriptional regulator [Eupransor demetentiae]|uniref:MerR family (SoxR) n=1 Tax=Eupransor demetentiae TaxID=3109584 RepID=A0ABP0ENA6_9LACO|nr:DNA-binding transcriptional regulator [Lactobacillaceae bacterium LMG 33000]